MANTYWGMTTEERERNRRIMAGGTSRDQRESDWDAKARDLEEHRRRHPEIAAKKGSYDGRGSAFNTDDNGSSFDNWQREQGSKAPDSSQLLEQYRQQKEEREARCETDRDFDALFDDSNRRGAGTSRRDKDSRHGTAHQSHDHKGYYPDYDKRFIEDMETHEEPDAVPYYSSRHSHTYPVSFDHHVGQVQTQKSLQQQRSLQASLQMAYSVFGNVITALETFEERENRKYGYPRQRTSNISIPDQSRKSDSDVKACLEAQLRVFETHMKVCQQDIKEEALSTMIPLLVEWLATRGSTKTFPPTVTDQFAAMLFEILVKGSTSHDPRLLKNQKVFSKNELFSNVRKVMQGQMRADDLDRSFHDDPRRRAEVPDVRRGGKFNDGLRRIELCNASLSVYTKQLKEPTAR